MRKTLALLSFFLATVSCNKDKFFDGPNSFSEDFENVAHADSLFPDDDSRWSFFQLTVDGNYFAIDTTRAHTGSRSMKFFAYRSPESASKCSIAKQNMAFREGETVRMDAWYYIEGTAPADWMFLFDLEEQVAIGAGPGMRIANIGADNNLVVEHKYFNPNVYQSAPARSFPRDQWVKLSVEVKLSQKKKGYVRVYQNDTLIISQDNWRTMPKDFLYSQQGTKGIYSSVEFGITANTTESDMTIYVDDIDVRTLQ
jgi:hypothetical protein